jgi:hypothetical protein
MAVLGRKPPLGDHGWISSPERREPAMSGRTACSGVSEPGARKLPFALPVFPTGDAPTETWVRTGDGLETLGVFS